MVTPDGRDVVIALCTPGDVLGEVSAIDDLPRSATATALDTVEARVVGGEDFRAFLASSAPAAFALLTSLCGRLRTSDRRRVEYVELDSTGRVARLLVELADEFGVNSSDGSLLIDLPITQNDLAGWTGSSKESVAKALKALRGRGWIITARRRITIVDLKGLRTRAS
jgi:CRP-like cAMP-binding protein